MVALLSQHRSTYTIPEIYTTDLSQQDWRWLRYASKEALLSDSLYRHGAVMVSSGKMIGRGHNKMLSWIPEVSKGPVSIHAEQIALRYDTRRTTLYLVRVMGTGLWGPSKPCADCQDLILSSGVTRVVYSVEPDIAYSVKVRDLL